MAGEKDLENAIKALTRTIKDTNFYGGSAQPQNGGSKAVDEATKLSAASEKILKNHVRYQQILADEAVISGKINTLAAKNEKLEKARLFHVQKMKELQDLTAHGYSNFTLEQKKHVDLAKIEVDKAKELYELTEQQIKLDEERAKILIDNNIKEEKAAKNREKFDKAKKNVGDWLITQGKSMLSSLLEQDSAISKISSNYALSRAESGELKLNLSKVAWQTQMIGVGMLDLVKIQTAYTDQTQRASLLTGDSLKAIATMGVATGIGAEGAAAMAANFDQFGYSVLSTSELVDDMMQKSKANGISASVATKNLEGNLKTANSYSFARGMAGVSDMTIQTAKLKINFSTIAAMADKLQSVEDSITMGANLQNLGGSFAALGEPLNLLNQGLTDMEGLSKTYEKMLSGIATVNKETGEVKIGSYDRLRVKAAATAMNVSFDEMMESTRMKAKREAVAVPLKMVNASDQDKELITSLATFEKGKGFTVNIKGESKSIAKLSPSDIKYLQPDKVQLATVAEATLGIKDVLTNGFEAVKTALFDLLLPAINTITGILQKVFGLLIPNVEQGLNGTRNAAGMITGAGGNAMASGISGLYGASMGGIGAMGAKATSLISAGGAGNVAAGVGMKGLTGILGSIAKFMPLIGGAISGIGEYNESGNAGRAVGRGVGAMSGAYAGGAIGAAVGGPIGLLLGALAGAGLSYVAGNVGANLLGSFDQAQDMIIPSGGRPIMLNSKDDVIALKPTGAINEALSPRNTAQNNYSYASPTPAYNVNTNGNNIGGKIKLDLSGAIDLKTSGGGSSRIDASELIRNRQFIRELTRLITQTQSSMDNGGTVSSKLNANAF